MLPIARPLLDLVEIAPVGMGGIVGFFVGLPGGQLDDCAVLKRLQKCLSLATGSRQ